MKKTVIVIAIIFLTCSIAGANGITLTQGSVVEGPKGPQGDKGPTGDKGQQGDPGSQGSPGQNGQNGLDGQPGQNGSPGSPGDKGQTGDKGPTGDAGFTFPVGYIYISTDATNPATVLGYGTWAAFGAGRVLVGYDSGDSDFNASEKTGGAKTVQSSAQSFAGTQSTTVVNHVHVQRYGTPATGNYTTSAVVDTSSGGTGGTVGTAATAVSTDNPTGGSANYTPAVFVVQYEGHYWSPCSGNVCLAVNCAPQGCYTAGETTFCPDEQCVNSIVEKSGEEHLVGVWKIEWDKYRKQGKIEEMKPVKSYRIELKKK